MVAGEEGKTPGRVLLGGGPVVQVDLPLHMRAGWAPFNGSNGQVRHLALFFKEAASTEWGCCWEGCMICSTSQHGHVMPAMAATSTAIHHLYSSKTPLFSLLLTPMP